MSIEKKIRIIKKPIETVEKPASERLMENAHPAAEAAGRNWGPARRVGSPSEARTNPEE